MGRDEVRYVAPRCDVTRVMHDTVPSPRANVRATFREVGVLPGEVDRIRHHHFPHLSSELHEAPSSLRHHRHGIGTSWQTGIEGWG